VTRASAWLGRWVSALAVLITLCGILTPVPFTAALARESSQTIAAAQLPPEAHATLALIRERGPYPYERDGVVFGNFERRLPVRERSYYREYTVQTPGVSHRGARRIVVGRQGELYYTSNHYRSFRRIVE
jgi:ribonuclease T1